MTRPFRFSMMPEVKVPGEVLDTVADPDREVQALTQGEQILAHARKAEAVGLHVYYGADHLYDTPDALIQCMAIASATSLRVGQAVLSNDFRHPVQVAKQIASIDVFSGGRVEVGIGAGYNHEEFRQCGVPFDPPKVRIARLREAAIIINALLRSDEPVTFKGEHYTIDGLMGMPRPVQQPGPPLMIGGGGRVMLKMAGELADIVDIYPQNLYPSGLPRDPRQFTGEALAQKIEWVREGAGSRFDSVVLGFAMLKVVVTEDREASAHEVQAEFDGAYRMLHGHEDGFPLSPDEVLESPYFYIGTHDEIAEHALRIRSTFGTSQLLVLSGHLDDFAPVVERLRDK